MEFGAASVLATGLATGGAFLGMAWKADDMVSKELREDLILWLLCIEPEKVEKSIQRWPTHFAALFDRVFGKKHLSRDCFFPVQHCVIFGGCAVHPDLAVCGTSCRQRSSRFVALAP